MFKKVNWLFIMNNRGEVGGEEVKESFGEAIVDALDKEEKPAVETPAVETPAVETPAAWDKVERRKSYEGEKRRAVDKVDPDPEHEMDFEVEEGKGKAKMKLSDLKGTAKWIRDNGRMIASYLKTREMANKHPEYGKLLDGVITRSFDDKGNFNKDFAEKTLSALEGKVDKVETKIEEKDELIDKMQGQLEDLDPDSPQAKVLKDSIAYQKNLKAEFKRQIGEANKKIDDLAGKLTAVDKKHTDFLSEQDKAETTVEVKRISGIYEKEIGALTEGFKKDGFEFDDDDERKEFDSAVRNTVAANSKDIKDDAGFAKLVQSTAKAVKDKISKRRESHVNKYLSKKGQPPKKEGEASKKKEEVNDDPLKGKTMGEVLAEGMFSETK